MEVGGDGDYIHCHHQNDSCIKMGSDESHFNVLLTVRDKVTRQCPQTECVIVLLNTYPAQCKQEMSVEV